MSELVLFIKVWIDMQMVEMMKQSIRIACVIAGIVIQGECLIVFGTNKGLRSTYAFFPRGQTHGVGCPSTRRSMARTDDTLEGGSKKIIVSSEMDIDVPIEMAYDAFRDLPRQPSWSPWLRSVEYLDGDANKSLWKMKYLGLTISWKAKNTNLQRPNLIEWESVSGLKNYGRVEFEKLTPQFTRMRFVMTFEPPRVVGSLVGKSKKIRNIVEEKMLQKTLQNFRNIIVAENGLEAVILESDRNSALTGVREPRVKE